jgi:phage/plasmid-like protein (TIGR03299 family)
VAHELNFQNGQASMMYVGEAPWHGLGTKLNEPATAAEAIAAAGLDWRVSKQPLYAIAGHVVLPVANKFAIVREDLWGKQECPVYGIVGSDYTPLQNHEAFAFFDPIVGEKNAAIYHTAGALGEGERVWILAKLPSDMHVIGDDIANKYLLLSNSHDGNSSVQIKFTPIRVVCQNTLTMALSEGPTIRVPHTRDLQARLKQAERALGLINVRFDQLEDSFKAMVRVAIDRTKLSEYLQDVFPYPRDSENERALKRAQENRLLAECLFAEGQGNQLKGVTGTLWAAYNGVTELIDHRATAQPNDRRLDSVWFGAGYSTKARAYRVAVDKTKTWLN